MADVFDALAEQLRSRRRDLLVGWVDAYKRSPFRMPGPVDGPSLESRVEPILENFADALSPGRGGHPAPSKLSPGSSVLRELEKSVAFVGATLGGSKASGYDAAALMWSLRDLLSEHVDGAAERELRTYLDWLLVIAMESLGTARESALIEHLHDELDEGTPIVLVTEELPAMLLVGRPSPRVIGSLFARLLLQIVRVGAGAAILDVTGLARPIASEFYDELRGLRQHRKVSGAVSLHAVGVADDERAEWVDEEGGAPVDSCSSFDQAVDRALGQLGRRIVAPRV